MLIIHAWRGHSEEYAIVALSSNPLDVPKYGNSDLNEWRNSKSEVLKPVNNGCAPAKTTSHHTNSSHTVGSLSYSAARIVLFILT